MADTTPEYLRGFLIPMGLGASNIWTAQSSFSQQGNKTGDSQPQQNTPMRVISTGSQSVSGDISIITRGAGSSDIGRFTFTQNNDSNTIEYGRDSFNTISGFEMLNQASAVSDQYFFPTAHVDSADSIYISYHFVDNPAGTNKAAYTKITRDGTQSTNTVFSTPTFATITQKYHPNMVTLSDDSLVYFHVIEDGGTANIRAHRSVDAGSTWKTISRECLKTPIPVGITSGIGINTYHIQRIRIAQLNGVVLMLIETVINNTTITKRNQLFQYVSIDNGCNFERITTDAQLSSESFHSITLDVRFERFVVSYCATTNNIHYMILPNGYSSIHLMRQAEEYSVPTTQTVTTGTNDYMEDGDISILSGEDGTQYIIYYNQSRLFFAMKISSAGVTWEEPNGNVGIEDYTNIFGTDDSSSRLGNISTTKWLGRGIIVSNVVSSFSNLGPSLCITFLGGYSNVNIPKSSFSSGYTDSNRGCYLVNYLPVDEPSNIAGLNVVGTADDRITSGMLSIESSTTYNSNRYYRFNNPTQGIVVSDNNLYTTSGVIARISYKVVSGGSVTSGFDESGIFISIDNGTTANYAIKLIASTTQFRLFDNVAPSVIGTVNFDMTQGVDIYIAISNGKVSTYYRGLDNGELRKYLEGPSSQTLSNGGGSSAGYVIQWGHLNYSSSTTMTSQWKGVHVSTLGGTGVQFSDGFENPENLNARLYPPIGRYAYIHDGVRISSTNGPTYEGDKWNIETAYSYPVENIYHSIAPTPRVGWRSQSVLSGLVPAQEIAFKFDDDLTNSNNDNFPNDLMGIHINGVNWTLGDIYYYDGGWVSLGSIVNYIRSFCTVNGRTVIGNTGIDEPYLTFNECSGWTCYLLDGATKHFRKIISNTEGIFGGTSVGTKQAVLTLDEYPPQTCNVIYLIPPILTLVMNMNGKKAQGFKISIDSQQTYDNDIRIGEIVIGPVVVPGRQYSRGRTISIESGTETVETQDGIRYSREIKPPTRVFRIAWTDGIDISSLQGDSPNPDYWMSSNQTGAQPIAIENDVPDLMLNMVRYLKGSVHPIVYIPNISKSTSGSGDFRLLNRSTEQALVTLESDIEISHVVGDELQSNNVGEVFRVASINLREIT